MTRQTVISGTAYTASILAFFTITLLGWHLMPNGIWGLYSLTDGALAAWNSQSILEWSRPFDSAPYNHFQGLGSLYIPNTPWLNPGALMLSLPASRPVAYYLSYAAYFFEALLSTVILCRTLRLPSVACVLVAELVCLVLFPPFTNYFRSLPWLSLAPFNAHLLAICNLILASLLLLGGVSRTRNLFLLLATFALLGVGFYSAEVTFLTFAPAYALFALAVVLQQPDRRSLGWRGSVILVAVVLAMLLRLPEFYQATGAVTSSLLITPPAPPFSIGWELLKSFAHAWRSFDWCSNPQVFLCSTYPISYVHWGGLLGAAAAVVFFRGMLRMLGATMLVFVLLVHAFAVARKAGLLGAVARINTSYFFFSAYVFHALFCIVLLMVLLRFLAGIARAMLETRTGNPGFRWTSRWLEIHGRIHRLLLSGRVASALERAARLDALWRALVLLAVPGLSIYILFALQGPALRELIRGGGLPSASVHEPVPNPILQTLEGEARLVEGERFRGRVVSLFGDKAGPLRTKLGFSPDEPFSPVIVVDSRFYMQAWYGNSFMMTDLWGKGIPTYEEYGQWVTKPLYVFTREMLGAKGDSWPSWETNVYKLDPRVLPALGVRFVISDVAISEPKDGLQLRSVLRAKRGASPLRPNIAAFARKGQGILEGDPIPVYLYEFTNPNLGDYTPLNPTVAPTARQALARMQEASFVFRDDIVVHEQLQGPFLPAVTKEFSVGKGRIRIRAESAGRSILLLPLQYSRCLTLTLNESAGPSSPPRLLRANLVQTALIFEGHVNADISFGFGVGSSVRCRQNDVLDYRQLDFSAWGRS